MKRVILLGSGNVATHLGNAIRQAGYVPEQVYSRTLAHAGRLAAYLDGADATNDLTAKRAQGNVGFIQS